MANQGFRRHLKILSKRLARKVFEVGQHLGVDILPRHFYSGIPDLRHLKRSNEWMKPRSMIGVAGAEIDGQIQFARDICAPFATELATGNIWERACAAGNEIGFGSVEADFLYCFVAARRPRRIVQVGCGVSTAIMLAAADQAHYQPEIICVEPFPSNYLNELNRAGRVRLVGQRAQDVDLELLYGLNGGDLLFIDSTHTVAVGSEVNRIILEALPRLTRGTFVHFHDVTFPYDYPRNLMTEDLFFWNESTLLHGFLVNNPRFTIRVAMSMLHYARPNALQQMLPRYRPQANHEGLASSAEGDFPASIYLEVVN
jgi:predicted O-methyltransferase YrrM